MVDELTEIRVAGRDPEVVVGLTRGSDHGLGELHDRTIVNALAFGEDAPEAGTL